MGNQDSLGMIERVFRSAGVEFLPGNGVRLHDPEPTKMAGLP